MLKRFIGAALALTLAAGLAGCGSTTSTTPKTNDQPAAPAAAPVEITFWHAMNTTSAQGKTLGDIIAAFNASQKQYKVTDTYQGGYSDLNTKLLAAVAAKTPPTIAQLNDDVMAKLAASKSIVPIDSFVNSMKAEDKADFAPSLLANVQIGGHYYGWPFNKSAVIFYYDKTLMSAAPKTQEEFIAMSKQAIKSAGGQVSVYGSAFQNTVDTFSMFFIQNGGKWLSADGKTAAFNGPEGVAAMQTIADMIKSNAAFMIDPKSYQSDNFNQGKAANIASTSASLSYIKKNGADGKPVWAVAPLFSGKTNLVDAAGTEIGIFAGVSDDQQKGAWAFMQFLTNAENTATWAVKTGYLPLRDSAKQTATWKDAVAKDPNIAVGADELSRLSFQPAIPQWYDVRGEMTKAVQAVAQGTDPKTALDAAAQKVNALLAK